MLVDHEKRSLHGALKMADIWEDATNRVKQGILAEEPEAALAGAMDLLANLGRVLEVISQDTDRIATALEGGTKPQEKPPVAAVPVADESTPKEHDL
jgi:hypothetical protein